MQDFICLRCVRKDDCGEGDSGGRSAIVIVIVIAINRGDLLERQTGRDLRTTKGPASNTSAM